MTHFGTICLLSHCSMVKSSHISGISIDSFQVLVAGRYQFHSFVDFHSTFQLKQVKNFWKDDIPGFLMIYNKSRNNLFATRCRMVKSSHISGISIDSFQVLVAGRYQFHSFVDFHLTFQWKQVKHFWKDDIPSFLMIYNKFRNNLFGPLYHLNNLERCFAQA